MTQHNRRIFLQRLAGASATASPLLWRVPIASAQPSPPANLRTAPLSLGLEQLTYRGMCEAPNSGFSYSGGQVAVRYVGDERRLLMLQWKVKDATNTTTAALTELRMPALAPTVAGSRPMTIVRQWKNWHWLPTGSLLDQLANGWLIGGLWWDEEQHVLWYTMWPYYAPNVVMPFLGAVRPNDDGTVTKYGPWHYVSKSTDAYRKVCWYIVPVPPRFQPLLGGRRVALGANTLGASGGSPTNWGPGLTALHLPSLSSTQDVEGGVPLMDYSPGAGGLAHPYYHCRRETDYQSFYGPGAQGGAIPGPVGSQGFWQASADMALPACWLDTPKHSGLLLIGQRTSRDTWYGLANQRNTYNASGAYAGRTIVDPPDTMAEDQGSTGYHSNGWQSAAWVVRSQHLEQVAKGTRKPSADEMRPELVGQWHSRWPEIPRPIKRPYTSDEGMVVDTRTNEMIWVHGISKLVGCCAVLPTVHVFGLPA